MLSGVSRHDDVLVYADAGDDGAKAAARALLEEFGWRDVLDLGDLKAARAMEMYLPLWLRLMGAVGSPSFNVKVVR